MQQQLKFIIVDDGEIDRFTIEFEASKFPFLVKIASCSHALEAMEFISRFNPDIIFADIEMPGISGLDMIKSLPVKIPAPVFVTSHPEFALEGYDMDAFDYLLKPVNAERFKKCALRLQDFFLLRANAFAYTKKQESDSIVIKQGYDKYKISIHSIIYLEAMKDYTRVITSEKQFLILETLSSMHTRLPGDTFLRIHRSYIVNRMKIDTVKGNKIYAGLNELPVGKVYKNVLGEIF